MSCKCNKTYPCGWDYAPSIYITGEPPLSGNGMSVALKYGDGLYLDEEGNLCSEAGSGASGNVNDVKVNGTSVVSSHIANIDLTPYALSSVVETQLTNIENQIEVISGETQPLSAGSGITIVDNHINVKGGHIVNDANCTTAGNSGTVLTIKADGNPSNLVVAKFGKINGQLMVNDFESFSLLSGATIAGGDATITDYKAVIPSATTSVFGVVKVDNAINSASTNPVQNAVISDALDGKVNGAFTMVVLTTAQWEALTVKNPDTVYLIKD